MKFKKNNQTFPLVASIILFILCIIFIIITCSMRLNEYYNMIIPIIIIVFPCIIIILSLNYENKKIYEERITLKKDFMDGEKIVGYIVDTFNYHYRIGRHNSGEMYGIKVLANNKIYVVRWLENNETFKTIGNKLNDIQVNNDTISFEKIPVDVYLKNDDYYVDIESIKI